MGLFDKLVNKSDENSINKSDVVEQTAAKIDNPIPISSQDPVLKVDPNEMFMGGSTKEDEITKLVSEVVQNEEKQAEEAVIELMSGSASDAIVMTTKVNENSENTISNDDSFEIENKPEENIINAPVEDIKSSEGFIPLEIINAQIANQNEVGDQVQIIKDEPEVEKVVIEFSSNKATPEPEVSVTTQPIIEQPVIEPISPIIELTNEQTDNSNKIEETFEKPTEISYVSNTEPAEETYSYTWTPDDFEQSVSWTPSVEIQNIDIYNAKEDPQIEVSSSEPVDSNVENKVEEQKNELPYSSVADFSLNIDYSEIEKAIQEMIASNVAANEEEKMNLSQSQEDEPNTFTIATIEHPGFNLNPIPNVEYDYNSSFDNMYSDPVVISQEIEKQNETSQNDYTMDIAQIEEEISKFLNENKEDGIVPIIEAPSFELNPKPNIEYTYPEEPSKKDEKELSFSSFNFDEEFANIENELNKLITKEEKEEISTVEPTTNITEVKIENDSDEEENVSIGTFDFDKDLANIEAEISKMLKAVQEEKTVPVIEVPSFDLNPKPNIEYTYKFEVDEPENVKPANPETENSINTFNFDEEYATIEDELRKMLSESEESAQRDEEIQVDINSMPTEEVASKDNYSSIISDTELPFGSYNFDDEYADIEKALMYSSQPEEKVEVAPIIEKTSEENNNYIETNEFDAFSWMPSDEPTLDFNITKTEEKAAKEDAVLPMINPDEETEVSKEDIVDDNKPIIEEEVNEINIDDEETKMFENPFANINEEEINSVVLESTNAIEEVHMAKEETAPVVEKSLEETQIIPQVTVTSISEEIEEKAQALAEEKVQEILSHYKGNTEPTTDNDHAVAYISEAPDTKFCNHCGTTLTNDCHICPSCGETIK